MDKDKVKICAKCKKPIKSKFYMTSDDNPNEYLHELCYIQKGVDSESVFGQASMEDIIEAFTPSGPLQRSVTISVPKKIRVKDYLRSQGLSTKNCVITHPNINVTENTIL
ncbi:MAG: hypothetical protein ACTSR2_05975, partial [Candidatus Hodarchaeales archaeon]